MSAPNKHFLDKIKQRIISKNASILEALKLMDTIDKKLLFVFENNKFINLLSIGDIQRAIIRNNSLDTPINNILREQVKMSYDNESFKDIKDRMLQYRTECMPVLDSQKNLVDVYFWEDIFSPEEKRIIKNIDIPAVIMAGGRGERLKPITNIIPKALMPIGEKPILEIIIDRLNEIGINDFYISVNYKKDMIKQYFKQLDNKGYNIKYLEETKPLGTGGSLYLLKNKLLSTFFVSNCDILIEQDFREVYQYHKENRNELTVISALKHYPIAYGTLETGPNGILTKMKEKPELTFQVNTGMYILEPHLLKEIPEDTFFQITTLIDKVFKRGGKIGVFPVSEHSWIDIGIWKKYEESINEFKNWINI
jgi:dTDP-glucose pyrophosphorylase